MEVTTWLKPQAATDMLDLKSPRHTSRRTCIEHMLSAYHPIATHERRAWIGRFVPKAFVSRYRRVTLRRFLHHRERVPIWVLEEGHPKIVILHFGDQTGVLTKGHATGLKFADRQSNVRTPEIDDRASLNIVSVARPFEQQPHSRAVEKTQIAETIKFPKPELLTEEGLGAINVSDSQRDLSYMVQI